MTRTVKALLFGLAGATLLSAAMVTAAAAVTAEEKPAWQAPVAETFEPITPAPTTTEPTTGPTLTVADLDLSAKVARKQCFGSAGCQVTVKIEVGYGGPALAPDATWEITYELTGDESGPIIGTFELSGEKYDQDEINMSTRSTRTKIAVKATDVGLVG